MDPWLPSSRFSWGAYPTGPVANNLADQSFLWDRGNRAASNYSLIDMATPGGFQEVLAGPIRREFQTALPVVPPQCTPLKGGCMVPPLAECRSSLKTP